MSELIFDPKTMLELPNVDGIEELWDSQGTRWKRSPDYTPGVTYWTNDAGHENSLGVLLDSYGFLSCTKPSTKVINVGDILKSEEDFDQCLTGTVIIGKQQQVWQRNKIGTWDTPASHFAGTHPSSKFFAPDLAKWAYPGAGPWTVIYTPTSKK